MADFITCAEKYSSDFFSFTSLHPLNEESMSNFQLLHFAAVV